MFYRKLLLLIFTLSKYKSSSFNISTCPNKTLSCNFAGNAIYSSLLCEIHCMANLQQSHTTSVVSKTMVCVTVPDSMFLPENFTAYSNYKFNVLQLW